MSQRREIWKSVYCIRARDHLSRISASFVAKTTSEECEGRVAIQRLHRALSLSRTTSQ